MSIEEIIRITFAEVCRDSGKAEISPPLPETVLLQSGLDSLGFAILVARLEEKLGYDPFLLMDEPVYPKTFGDFTDIYEKLKPA